MKLIILYGPPAAGKLTIAEELVKKTGYKLLHNHLTVDLLKSVFDFGTPAFFQLNQKIKLDVLEAAAKEGFPGLIHTFVYDKKTDNPFVSQIIDICQKYGVDVRFIQLCCDKGQLLQRVTEESRKRFKKVTSSEGLQKYLESGDFLSPIEFVESTKINSDGLSVAETVELVMQALQN